MIPAPVEKAYRYIRKDEVKHMAKSRILIVNDQPEVTNTFSTILRARGYFVSTASRGEDGLEKVKTDRPDVVLLDVNPYKLMFNRELVEIFDKIIKDFPPDIIYTSWIYDSHQDHITVSKATIAAARKNACSLYMYEQALPSGLTPYAFRPQAFVDISDTIELKIKSVSAHQSQVQSFSEQWIQGIIAKATYMGFQINVNYAEAFEVVKEIKKI